MDADQTAALVSAVQKAFGPRMNSMWSAWANAKLTGDEIAALAEAGVAVNPNVSEVRVVTDIDLSD